MEIILIENGSKEKETFRLYEQLKQDPRIQILKWDQPFQPWRVNNWAATQANGEILLFLNNATQVINQDWLEQMLQFSIRQDIGAVGAKIYYPDGSIEHGGIIIGIGRGAGYSYRHYPKSDPGYFLQLVTLRNVSAVSGICLMLRKQVFQEVDGFDGNYSNELGDVDLCLRIMQKGYRNVWTPYAELFHYESGSTSKALKKSEKEIRYFKQTWAEFLASGDPYYNPNLTLECENYDLNLPCS
jgi:GT2 family glycosyltransferase